MLLVDVNLAVGPACGVSRMEEFLISRLHCLHSPIEYRLYY